MDRTRGRIWGRSDSILVAVFDDVNAHVGVVSVPRDLHVDVPGHGPARINAVMRIATRLDEDPLRLLSRVVSDTLAMPIQHVIVADLEAFERTVDELGGVVVDVRCPLMDNFIDPRTPSGRRRLDVQAGTQRLDGVTAAMYVRSRHGRSDWSRARRQQAVLLGLRDRVRELGVSEWGPVLHRALESGVISTMSRLELAGLARRLRRIERGRLHGLLIGHREVEHHRTVEGRAVLVPDLNAIDRALSRLFSAPAPGVVPPGRPCPAADSALR
jgi:LCP family protein required for cell wall assembly